MGIIPTLWRTYSSKIKFAIIIFILLTLVGGFFYIKKLRSDIALVSFENKQLTLDIEASEAEKLLLLAKVSDSNKKITQLDILVSSHAQEASMHKRSLEKLKVDYQKLIETDPSAASKILVTEYNSFVGQLYCTTGGSTCADN